MDPWTNGRMHPHPHLKSEKWMDMGGVVGTDTTTDRLRSYYNIYIDYPN